jgi:hypothetical protein
MEFSVAKVWPVKNDCARADIRNPRRAIAVGRSGHGGICSRRSIETSARAAACSFEETQ